MSWSLPVGTTTPDELRGVAQAKLNDSFAAAKKQNKGELPDSIAQVATEQIEQVEAAVEAALQLCAAVGVPPGREVNVHLSGHANPGHQPTDGYSNDTISVSVSLVGEPLAVSTDVGGTDAAAKPADAVDKT